jgi:hypothetical protein
MEGSQKKKEKGQSERRKKMGTREGGELEGIVKKK